MADSLFHPHPQTLFWSQELVHDGELGSLEEMESGMGPLLRWKRVAAVDKLAPCNLSRYLHAARSPDPHSTFSTCRPTNPPGWLISRRGTFFSSSRFVTIRCPFLRPSLNSIRRVLATCLRRRHRHPHRHRRRSCHLHFSKPPPPGYPPPSSSYSILTLYLPTTCLGPSVRPASAIQSVASSSSSEQVSSQTRATRSVCPEPSHRLHLPDSSACGRVA